MSLIQQVESYYNDICYQFDLLKKYSSQSQLYLSSEFNVFDYINPNENRLSDIVAELLNPKGKHGQGDVFLLKFLELLDLPNREKLRASIPLIYREASTSLIKHTQKRIDILLDWREFGMVIENKPWATDQIEQISDYRNYMRARYGNNFLIVYLSKSNTTPNELSISAGDLDILKMQGQYINVLFAYGFLNWLISCRNICQSDKYRWFLRDFIDYIKYDL
ncbi:PD-(D/E)XK nuclease family protein [Mucilaginibacter rubeus]|uniref:Uncharacterized protein n=1 Tax=Mucilaginibacter rubeus TaxID=2027860 RepID=A0A5C1HYG8_9SPHI|nr:PD-(D/E)XK nuclease family protein [Mucilaginibacter rubeus]QEM10190.1 hypothetical protein DEO27_009185 [Mucilaginibacter rubeus]